MAIPKYQQIKDELKQQIISGKFENGDKFYTEAELIQLFNVSSITVVRALNELANDGYIIRQQGKGTFVSRARKHKLVEFSDVETFPIQKDKVTVLSIKRGNNLKILEKLELAPTQFYYKMTVSETRKGKLISTTKPISLSSISTQIIQIWTTTAQSTIASKQTIIST